MKERFVKLKDLNGFDDEFLNALGELEQRIFESYNKFMPLKEGGRPGTVPGEHPMFTEFKENFGYDTSGRKYLRLVTGAFGEGQTSVWGFIAKSDFEKVNKLHLLTHPYSWTKKGLQDNYVNYLSLIKERTEELVFSMNTETKTFPKEILESLK